jgi:sigma-E factor negative regulatory protein RseA
VVTRLAAPAPDAATTALAAAEPVQVLTSSPEGAGPALPPAGEMQFIRDSRLDRYLAAHKQFGGDALAVPGVSLRHAAVVVPDR